MDHVTAHVTDHVTDHVGAGRTGDGLCRVVLEGELDADGGAVVGVEEGSMALKLGEGEDVAMLERAVPEG